MCIQDSIKTESLETKVNRLDSTIKVLVDRMIGKSNKFECGDRVTFDYRYYVSYSNSITGTIAVKRINYNNLEWEYDLISCDGSKFDNKREHELTIVNPKVK